MAIAYKDNWYVGEVQDIKEVGPKVSGHCIRTTGTLGCVGHKQGWARS